MNYDLLIIVIYFLVGGLICMYGEYKLIEGEDRDYFIIAILWPLLTIILIFISPFIGAAAIGEYLRKRNKR